MPVSRKETIVPPCAAELGFRLGLRQNWQDDTVRLVYADWLDEHRRYRPAARLRWWVGARQAIRANVRWEGGDGWEGVTRALQRVDAEWVRRLYAVEIARTVRDKYPLAASWAAVAAVSNASLATAELFALLLASQEELSAARSAARSAAWSAARSAAWSAAQSAAESAARSAAEAVANHPPLVEGE